jgi:hypothetical protein
MCLSILRMPEFRALYLVQLLIFIVMYVRYEVLALVKKIHIFFFFWVMTLLSLVGKCQCFEDNIYVSIYRAETHLSAQAVS